MYAGCLKEFEAAAPTTDVLKRNSTLAVLHPLVCRLSEKNSAHLAFTIYNITDNPRRIVVRNLRNSRRWAVHGFNFALRVATISLIPRTTQPVVS